MKYENKRNGQLFEQVGEVHSKYNTVLLRNVETGKEQTVTTSTLKRWYKKVEEAPVAEPEVVRLVLTDMDAMVDCSAAQEEIDTEIVDDVPGMEPEAADREHYRTAAEAYLTALGYEWKRDKQGRTIVRQGGKTCAELYFGKRGWKVNVRADRAAALPKAVTVRHYYLPFTQGNISYTNTAIMVDVFG